MATMAELREAGRIQLMLRDAVGTATSAAKAAGQPSVFGHGMFSMGLLASAIDDYVGVGNLLNYKVRLARPTWPDEELTTKTTVVAVHDRDRTLDLDVRLLNHDGEEKVVGRATASAKGTS